MNEGTQTAATGFFAARAPLVEIKAEKPEHKLILFMRAQGKSQYEISELTGYSITHINTIEAQPWFKAQLDAEIKSIGRDLIQDKLKEFALPALEKMNRLAHHAKSEQVQASACADIMNRFLGKPMQRTENKNENISKIESVESDNAELEKLRKEREATEELRRQLKNREQAVGLNN